jgi:hypothetical protein
MAVECIGDVAVEASQAACFSATADILRWPDWAKDLERAEVLESPADGRPARVRMVADLFGKEFDAIIDVVVDKGPGELSFTLVEARKLTTLEALFRFEPEAAGTRLSYQLRMVLVKPKAARIEKMVSRKIDTALSRDLRRHIERGARR